jgi:hypothetical protein
MAENSLRSEGTLNNPSLKPIEEKKPTTEDEQQQDLSSLLLPNPKDLPQIPPSAVEINFSRHFVPGNFMGFRF